jgi:sulfur relay (sulfurtransferase) DsrC/TusE family protein
MKTKTTKKKTEKSLHVFLDEEDDWEMSFVELNQKKHEQIHAQLHVALIEILYDYLLHHKTKNVKTTTLRQLIRWSSRQIMEPSVITQKQYEQKLRK